MKIHFLNVVNVPFNQTLVGVGDKFAKNDIGLANRCYKAIGEGWSRCGGTESDCST